MAVLFLRLRLELADAVVAMSGGGRFVKRAALWDVARHDMLAIIALSFNREKKRHRC